MLNYKIINTDNLYRRVPKNKFYWKNVNGRKVPSSFAFKTKPNEDGLSVNIKVLTTLELTVENTELFGVAEFSASIPLGLGFTCRYDPKPDNDAHALIVGDTRRIAKKLSKAVIKIFYIEL